MNIISKRRAALLQLRTAILLYYENDIVSAITLAGAAEEILGKLVDEKYSVQLGRPVKYNYQDENAFLISHFIPYDVDMTDWSESDKDKFYKAIESDYRYSHRRTRNALKHKDIGEDEVVSDSFREDAEKHISAAIINYKYLKGQLPNNQLILNYCEKKGII